MSRRRFMTLAALGGSSAVLAACTGGGTSPSPSSTTAASAPAPSQEPSATPAPSYELESEMFLFNWSDYFSPDNKKAFQEQFNVAITEDTYPSNEELLAKLQAGGKGQYDVAVPTQEFVVTLANGGFLQKLDKGRLPNLQYINPMFKGTPFDPNDEYLIPKDWGTTGIIYRGSVKEPV